MGRDVRGGAERMEHSTLNVWLRITRRGLYWGAGKWTVEMGSCTGRGVLADVISSNSTHWYLML